MVWVFCRFTGGLWGTKRQIQVHSSASRRLASLTFGLICSWVVGAAKQNHALLAARSGFGELILFKSNIFSTGRFPILFQAPGNLTRVFWHCLQMKPGVLPDVSQFGLSWALMSSGQPTS